VSEQSKSVTRTELIYAQLRTDILRGRYTPGQRLRLVELADHFSASQSVIREALTRLTEQKLVVALPQQGFRVMALTVTDLRDLTEARTEIETLVLRMAIERGDVTWEGAVLAAHHQLTRTSIEIAPDGTPSEQWFRAHEEFHRRLLDGCGNPWLIDLATTLRAAAGLHRRWSGSIGHDYDRDVAGEHQALLDAVLARDAEAAVTTLTHHIQRTTAALLSVASEEEPDSYTAAESG
jgi:DNA-binding GntR family transcriptional regulator